VAAGRFHLFAPGEGPTRELNYELPFFGSDGKPYLFTGYKRVPDSEDLRPWRATTTLVSFVREGHASDGPILATGILRLSMPALVKQLTTFRTPGARTPRESLVTLSRFGRLFVDKLVSSYADG
jgi:cholesterol oxidase